MTYNVEWEPIRPIGYGGGEEAIERVHSLEEKINELEHTLWLISQGHSNKHGRRYGGYDG